MGAYVYLYNIALFNKIIHNFLCIKSLILDSNKVDC